MATPTLSVVIPVLNEAAGIVAQLEALQALRHQGAEIVLVDGGSDDNTAELARPLVDQLIVSARGRAVQMNAGARSSGGETLLFLHADTRLPASADDSIRAAIAAGAVWGRFDIRIDNAHPMLRLVARMMNWRSRLTGIATGDQAIFVRRSSFEQIGGYPELPLMEDIALSKRLNRIAAPACLRDCVVTSGRRWEKHGVMRTILLMWRLRSAYFFGAAPDKLAVRYGYSPQVRTAANPPSPPYQGGVTERLSPPLTRGDREGFGGGKSSIHIAIFTKAPQPGAVKPRLIPTLGPLGAARLQRRLTLHAMEVATRFAPKKVTLWCAPDAQHRFFRALQTHCGIQVRSQAGANLGARMAHAFAVHDGPLLLIGSDCPALQVEHLEGAANALRDGNDAVFIPAEDGGYVLVGLRRPQPHLFEDIAWGGARVMAQTRERLLEAKLRWAEPFTLWDVDQAADLERLALLDGFAADFRRHK